MTPSGHLIYRKLDCAMMYRIDLSAFSKSECMKIQKDLQPYVWEIYDISYNPPIIDIHWDSEEPFERLFPALVPYASVQ